MGLVLYASADGDPSPSCRDRFPNLSGSHDSHDFSVDHDHDAYLADLVAHNRHIPASAGKRHDWRVGPSKTRLTAHRQAAWAYRYKFDHMGCRREESEAALLRHDRINWPRRLRPHQVRLLQKSSQVYFDRWQRFGEEVRGPCIYEGFYLGRHRGAPHVRGQRKSVRDEWVNQTAADVHSVHSGHSGHNARRPPSLERQGAFRAASTTKTRTMAGQARNVTSSSTSAADPDVAELYRLGILYDDEHERGAGFGLDAIVHDAPLFTICTASSSRRGRSRGKEPATAPSEVFEDIDLDSLPDGAPPALDLALSFSNLADDAALARFLQDEEMAAYLASLSDGAEHELPVVVAGPYSTPLSSSSQQPVTVIYELAPEAEAEIGIAPDAATELDADVDTNATTSDAGDWVLDMDMAEDRSIDGESILLRGDGDTGTGTDTDAAWILLRP